MHPRMKLWEFMKPRGRGRGAQLSNTAKAGADSFVVVNKNAKLGQPRYSLPIPGDPFVLQVTLQYFPFRFENLLRQ